MTNTDGLMMLDVCHLANTLTNINDISKVYLCYLANILTNTNGILKMDPRHLANILDNIDKKADDFTKEKIWLRLIDYSLLITR